MFMTSHYSMKDNLYSLLYGSIVNPYYSLSIVKRFILNNVIYMAIMLSLKHSEAPILFLYSLHLYYMPTNMSDYKETYGSYTKLDISHPYLIINNDQYSMLNDNFELFNIRYNHFYTFLPPL